MVRPSAFRTDRLILGACLTALGLAGVLGSLVLIYGDTPAIDHWRIQIGLALSTLGAGLAQVALLFGLFLLLTAKRR